MSLPSLILGSPQWMAVTLGLIGLSAIAILLCYARAAARRPVKIVAVLLKSAGFAALAISLLEPLLTGSRPRRGANAFVILADNSQSLQIRDGQSSGTNGDWMRRMLAGESEWKTRLGQDFDVRSYVFDSHLRAVEGFDGLTFDGASSALTTSLEGLAKRFRGLPLAGVLLFSDGNRTDLGEVDLSSLPPIYTVVPPSRSVARDIGVTQVSINQTNFESAPAVIRAEVSTAGITGQSVVAVLVDGAGKEVERQKQSANGDGKPLSFRFQFRPERKGVSFYRVEAYLAADRLNVEKKIDEVVSSEQALANNSRLVVVDQGAGPYRVLYVSGRPTGNSSFCAGQSTRTKRLSLPGCCGLPAARPSSTFVVRGLNRLVRCLMVSITLILKRPSAKISLCSFGWVQTLWS